MKGFIVPDNFYDVRFTQFCIFHHMILAVWNYIPEENCILRKKTLPWITADDDMEKSPDILSAKRLKLRNLYKKQTGLAHACWMLLRWVDTPSPWLLEEL